MDGRGRTSIAERHLTMAGVPVESAHADYVGEESPAADGSFLKDIGSLAVWSLSGAKPGNGIDQLLDDDVSF